MRFQGLGCENQFFWPCVLMFLSDPARGSSRCSRGRDRKNHEGYPGLPAEGINNSAIWVTPREMENESQRLRKNNLLDQSVFTNIMRFAGNWNRFNWGAPTTNSIQLCESPSNIIQGKSWYIHNSGNIMASPLNHLWVIRWPSVALASYGQFYPRKNDVFLVIVSSWLRKRREQWKLVCLNKSSLVTIHTIIHRWYHGQYTRVIKHV